MSYHLTVAINGRKIKTLQQVDISLRQGVIPLQQVDITMGQVAIQLQQVDITLGQVAIALQLDPTVLRIEAFISVQTKSCHFPT